MPLRIYVGRNENPQRDQDWEFQADCTDFDNAVVHAREIAKRLRVPTIICEDGWFNLRGHPTRPQEITCWWSDNYEAEMGFETPTKRGLGWYEKYDEIHPYLTDALAAAPPPPLTVPPLASQRTLTDREMERWLNLKPERPRTMFTHLMWLIFVLPGQSILWFEYYFPARGQVYGSGRRYGNKTVTVMTSLAFYASIAVLFGIAFVIGLDYHGG